MKRFVSFLSAAVLILGCLSASAQSKVNYVFTEASDLNLIGKIMPGTPNPYHRVDTVKYKGFTKSENNQVRCPTGLAVLFRTDSPVISVKTEWGSFIYESVATMPMAYRGYDLYIREKGEWIWAGNNAPSRTKPNDNMVIVANMDGKMHDCLLYMPNYTEVYSAKIGVAEGSKIEALESPFRHRIAIFGSSYTHGVSTSRSGMSYPMQFMRHTGLQMLSLGCSGNSKLQPYFAAVLEDVEADAYVFDSFSNPSAEQINERLIPFIDRLIAAHPGKPLIFQQTIRREKRNFDQEVERKEAAKQAMAEHLFKDVILPNPKYKDVYFIHPNASVANHEAMVDGIHPDDYGYYLWSKSIEKPILDILNKYGIYAPCQKNKYTEASSLTMVGKLFPDTPNPYHRVDTVKYKGFTATENLQVRMSSGLSVAFKTNSKAIAVKAVYDYVNDPTNTAPISARGYELYIKDNGKWVYAGAQAGTYKNPDKELQLISGMDGTEKECLLYLPLYSSEKSIKLVTDLDSYVVPAENPFRHRIAIFGSSYTHGSCTSRPSQSYPAWFCRNTGLQLLSLGCSGNSKLQPYFANALKDADVEAYIFDGFSNPSPEQIEKRLFPFIEQIQAAKPGVPLIFLKTIYRESRNFSPKADDKEQAKMDMADKMMKEACKKYKDVYWVTVTNSSKADHSTSVDGVHPNDEGYRLWAESIQKPVLKILAKYGIK